MLLAIAGVIIFTPLQPMYPGIQIAIIATTITTYIIAVLEKSVSIKTIMILYLIVLLGHWFGCLSLHPKVDIQHYGSLVYILICFFGSMISAVVAQKKMKL